MYTIILDKRNNQIALHGALSLTSLCLFRAVNRSINWLELDRVAIDFSLASFNRTMNHRVSKEI